jgi:hypothetical protein
VANLPYNLLNDPVYEIIVQIMNIIAVRIFHID